MFDQTWKWAGTYRKSEKNIGVLVHEIRDRLGAILGNVRYWIDNNTYEIDEVGASAIRWAQRSLCSLAYPVHTPGVDWTPSQSHVALCRKPTP